MIGGLGMKIDTPEYRELVRQDQPEGNFCQFCGNPNDFWDDLGWFYLNPNPGVRIARASCRSCYDGVPGQRHISRYGVGER